MFGRRQRRTRSDGDDSRAVDAETESGLDVVRRARVLGFDPVRVAIALGIDPERIDGDPPIWDTRR